MARTFGPTATTVAHANRLPTWAVAGMRMPPEERRSPSARSSFTRMRSLSILMGWRSFDEFSNVLAGAGAGRAGFASAVASSVGDTLTSATVAGIDTRRTGPARAIPGAAPPEVRGPGW